jgi:hypothetical protein
MSRASSTGRCDTIQCIDSTKLARENHLFGRARLEPSQGCVSAAITLTGDVGIRFQSQAGSSLVLRRPIEITVLTGPVPGVSETHVCGRVKIEILGSPDL